MSDSTEPRFELQNGVYSFFLGEKLIYSTPSMALLFSKRTGTLFKHGMIDFVRADYDRYVNSFLASGAKSLAMDFVVLEGSFSIEDLNRCVNCSGYGKRLLEKFQNSKLEPAD